MPFRFCARVLKARLVLPALVTALAASCAEAPKVIAPPPPPQAPPVSLSPKLIELASAYRAYMARASAISPTFLDGAAIAQSLRTGAGYEPQQMLRGAIAYAAVVALQDPVFVAGVRKYAVDANQRREIATQIVANPAFAVGFEGSDRAAGLVTQALRRDSTRLFTTGRAVKQAAYDVQHQEWSKAFVPDRDIRLIQARAASTTPLRADPADIAFLEQASTGAAPLAVSGDPAAPPYTPLVIRGLAVAAMAALGEAGDANSAQLDTLLSDPITGYCLNMSKLNLYQCLAVSKPHYEDVFCLGQHILRDTGQCLMKGSGAPMPIMVSTQPLALPPATGEVKIIKPKSSK